MARGRKPTPDYEVDGITGCWNWLKWVNPGGYGKIRVGARTWRAHRLYYERARGPIPEGLVLDHLCQNKRCINPDHLEAVTETENRRRRSHVTLDQVREVRRLGLGSAEAGRRLGITQSSGSSIVRGATWKEDK